MTIPRRYPTPRHLQDYAPRAFLDADGACRVEFGTLYPGAIALLKDRVPRQSRRYDRRRRAWLIAPQYALAALRVLRFMLPDTTVYTSTGPA